MLEPRKNSHLAVAALLLGLPALARSQAPEYPSLKYRSNYMSSYYLSHTPLPTPWAPAWSPDGAKIAFKSDRDGNWEIYVMNADGSGQTRLTNNPYYDWYAAWAQ